MITPNIDSSSRAIHLPLREPQRLHDAGLRAFVWFSIVVVCFVLNHPYHGISHDNVLYLAQALLRLSPDIYGGDAFFQWGSQDRYTLFSPIYTWLIMHFGLSHANIMLVVLSQGLFLAASFALVRALVPSGFRSLAMVFIVCSIGLYGGRLIFRMAEPFVTPRPLVEVATLVALLLLLSGRRYWALVPLAIGALFHPLVALSGIAYWWIYNLLEDRRWWWLLSLGVIPAAAGLAGIVPFTQLFQIFDQQWLQILQEDNVHLFVTQWAHTDWGMVAFDVGVLFIGTRFAEGVTRHALKAALTTAAATLGVTFLAADVLHNVLLTGLQPWRALWIVHWMAAAALPFVAFRLWNESAAGRLVAALLVFGFITRGLSASFAASILAITLFHFRNQLEIKPRLGQLVLCALAVGALANWGAIAWRAYQVEFATYANPAVDFALRVLPKPLPLLLFAAAMAWFGLNWRRDARPAAMIAAVLLVLAGTVWDRRAPFMTYLESAALGSHPFSRTVRPDQQVLWYGTVAAPWALMQRRSYYSPPQQAGQIFNRESAIELSRRRRAIATLTLQDTICNLMNNLNQGSGSCEPDVETVQQVCREAGNLDYIVLDTRIADKWVASWTWSEGQRHYYYLYECKTFI
jgi:hypothetical protein